LYQFFDLTDRVVVNDHRHKNLYQLSSTCTCEEKLIGKKQHTYERKSHETKVADFISQGVRKTGTQAQQPAKGKILGVAIFAGAVR